MKLQKYTIFFWMRAVSSIFLSPVGIYLKYSGLIQYYWFTLKKGKKLTAIICLIDMKWESIEYEDFKSYLCTDGLQCLPLHLCYWEVASDSFAGWLAYKYLLIHLHACNIPIGAQQRRKNHGDWWAHWMCHEWVNCWCPNSGGACTSWDSGVWHI